MFKFLKIPPLLADKVLQRQPRVSRGMVEYDVVTIDDPFPELSKNMKVSDFSLSILQKLGSDPNSGVVMLQRGKIENAVNFSRSACDENNFNSYVEDKKAYAREMASLKKESEKVETNNN